MHVKDVTEWNQLTVDAIDYSWFVDSDDNSCKKLKAIGTGGTRYNLLINHASQCAWTNTGSMISYFESLEMSNEDLIRWLVTTAE